MPEPIFDRIARHAAIFEKIAEKRAAAHYEELLQRGMEADSLAADLCKAMEVLIETGRR